MAKETKVTRIKASDTAPKAAKTPAKAKTAVKKSAPEKKKATNNKPNVVTRALRGIGGYFKGAWFELKQVRWPTRANTWALTLAVIIFSLFFAGVILALDQLFQYLFKLIIN